MSADLSIRTDGELMIASVQGFTEAGIDFVDAVPNPIEVVDADRILVSAGVVPLVERDAVLAGLSVDRAVVARLA